jgi:NAD(P)-dependent dehydrogenase (short-subunit alcohol dehydrogenase family)
VLSVVSPIKSNKGLTSTAVNSDHWRPRRYTLKEMAAMPPTFTLPDLLINTGLMLVNLSGPWVEEVCFDVNNLVYKAPNGRWKSEMEPEDWLDVMKVNFGGVFNCTRAASDSLASSCETCGRISSWDRDSRTAIFSCVWAESKLRAAL